MESNDKIKNRVKRIEDQIKGILRMLDDNKDSKKGDYTISGFWHSNGWYNRRYR